MAICNYKTGELISYVDIKDGENVINANDLTNESYDFFATAYLKSHNFVIYY